MNVLVAILISASIGTLIYLGTLVWLLERNFMGPWRKEIQRRERNLEKRKQEIERRTKALDDSN